MDLGQVFKIRIRHDHSGVGADWYLDQVEVVDVETEEVYMFLCERWLAKNKEDKRIERTFFVKVMEALRLILSFSQTQTQKHPPNLFITLFSHLS